MDDALVELQERREIEAYADAWKRFQEECDHSTLETSSPGQAVIRRIIPEFAEAIRFEQGRILAGASPRDWQEFIAVEPEKLSLLTLNTLLHAMGEKADDGVARSVKATLVQRRIGEACQMERMYGSLNFAEKAVYDAIAKRNKRLSDARRRAANALMKFQEHKVLPVDAIRLGGMLLDLAVKSTGIFQIHRAVKRPTRVRLTEKGMELLEEILRVLQSVLRPRFAAMIVPPLPWKIGAGGGYRRVQIPLVKREDQLAVSAALDRADLAIPSEAVNAIQETPWRIRRSLYDVLRSAVARRESKEVLPDLDGPSLPPKLPIATTPADLYAARKRERAQAWRLRNVAIANRIQMWARLSACEDLAAFEQFFFPMQLDWRGRAYPVPQAVQPQGDDFARALLEFAGGKPLGERGAYWLAVQLANLYGHGVDKGTFDERAAWVRDKQADILACAKKPYKAELWRNADKPWRFLAAAQEWAGYVKEGPGYVSHLPVAMDGTCNGLQHLSALGRDPEGGAWTNVVPSAAPMDVYQEVANRLKARVERLAAKGDPIAKEFVEIIQRDVVKRATMTTPYGITRKGIRKQLTAYLREKHAGRFEDEKEAAKFLTKPLAKSIAQVVVKAAEISAWLRQVAEALAEEKRGFSWTVPSGFRVPHEYLAEEKKRVETVTGSLLIRKPKARREINHVKQSNAVVPNLIHSLDAAHMMLTVRELHAKGLRDFAMVHDGYAVHACDVDLMNAALREQFVTVHTEFTLEKFTGQIRAEAPGVEIADPPAAGALELEKVRESLYFFS